MSKLRHQQFREETLKLILQKGFKGATMRELAHCLDCDVANIYNYIPSKQAFLKELLFEMSDHFHTGIDEIENASLDPINQIHRLVRLYVDLTCAFPLEVALLTNEWRHLEDPDLQKFISERDRFESRVERMVEEGIKSCELRKMKPGTATHLLLSSLRWLFQFVHKDPGINRLRLEQDIIDFVLLGLTKE